MREFIFSDIEYDEDYVNSKARKTYASGSGTYTSTNDYTHTSGSKSTISASGKFKFNEESNTATVSDAKYNYTVASGITYTSITRKTATGSFLFSNYAEVIHEGSFANSVGMKNTIKARIRVNSKGSVTK